MKTLNKYTALDVHKDTTVIAVADGDRSSDAVWPRGEGVARSVAEG